MAAMGLRTRGSWLPTTFQRNVPRYLRMQGPEQDQFGLLNQGMGTGDSGKASRGRVPTLLFPHTAISPDHSEVQLHKPLLPALLNGPAS